MLDLTSFDDKSPQPSTEPVVDDSSMGDINDGRVLPFLDVGLPEIGAFAARGNGVSPGALAGDAEVEGEKESKDGRDLRTYEKDGRVWQCGGDALGDVTVLVEAGANEHVSTLKGSLYPKSVSSARPLIQGDLSTMVITSVLLG